jgi:hypothetical protein
MAVTAKVYGPFLTSLATKKVDLSADTVKAMLCTSTYTPNQDTHQYKSDLTNEITGTGYTAGGVAVTVTATYDGPSNTLTISSTNPSWSSATITARYVVWYDSTPGTDATRPLICYADLGADQSVTGGTWTYTVPGTGIVTLVAA